MRWDDETYEKYVRHRWRVEGVHGQAKTQHGLRRAARRGLANVAIQVYLTAAVMNLKRLAALLWAFLFLARPIQRRRRSFCGGGFILGGFPTGLARKLRFPFAMP